MTGITYTYYVERWYPDAQQWNLVDVFANEQQAKLLILRHKRIEPTARFRIDRHPDSLEFDYDRH